MPNPVVAWELMVTDLATQESFYRQVFDWEFTPSAEGTWVAVTTGGADGTLTQHSPPQRDLTLVVQVEDVEAIVEKAIRLGGRVAFPPTPQADGGIIALIRDLEGNLVWVIRPAE